MATVRTDETRNHQTGAITRVAWLDDGTVTTTVNGINPTNRAQTPTEIAELAAYVASRTADANRATVGASLETFIEGAAAAIANMQAIQNDPAPTFTNLAQALTQVTSLQNRVKLIATTQEAHIRKTVALARYVSGQLDSLENT